MNDEPKNQIRELTKIQRRVIGVLMEKGFTTPDQYPLTLKAAMTACNQKSNRSPLTSYTESDVQDALDALREDLLVAEVFTDGGRAPRYRHYMRNKFDFSETQFAIIAELLLRGRQQPGELRSRASRMVRIESLEQLRSDLTDLQEKGFVQANGPLDRRGIEVDHTFYLPQENKQIGTAAPAPPESPPATPQRSTPAATGASDDFASADIVTTIERLSSTVQEQVAVIEKLSEMLSAMDDRLQRLERDLGV